MANTAVVEKKDEKLEKRKALGRGLASLLPGPRVVAPNTATPNLTPGPVPHIPPDPHADSSVPVRVSRSLHQESLGQVSGETLSVQSAASDQVIASLPLDSIDKNPYQTRSNFQEEALRELADSIKDNGVVQPIVVRPAEQPGRYLLVLGERRLRASKMADRATIPAIVRRLSPQQAAEMTVLENVQREDLNPIEQAEAYRVLSQEFHLTQVQIAERVGVSRESVANYMRLLRLPDEVKQYVSHGRIGFSEARELLSLENPKHILTVAEELLLGRLKWDDLKERVAHLNGEIPIPGSQQKETRGARWMDPNVRAAQMDMERTLGMRVRITDRNGKGRIVIEYASVDDYERIVEKLRKAS
ncbi:MAG TPA: ParB/RepB/Spo0J family partition protein [Candidatus Sulfotelmatobacter sp.]|jgi:ParB family chromosome partitioning protein